MTTVEQRDKKLEINARNIEEEKAKLERYDRFLAAEAENDGSDDGTPKLTKVEMYEKRLAHIQELLEKAKATPEKAESKSDRYMRLKEKAEQNLAELEKRQEWLAAMPVVEGTTGSRINKPEDWTEHPTNVEAQFTDAG